MTATVHHRPFSDTNDSLLRFALRADATLCAGVGLFVAMGAELLADVAGVTATVGYLAGAALAGYGVLLYVLAALSDIRAVGVGVLIGNVCFAVAGVVAVVSHRLPLTTLGAELLVGFVLATAGLSWLQFRGLGRLS
ncbi:hypothetical protein ACAG25_23770 [Mycobacterium sp. pV006]|uniref:hypothetical protein n=1 Tax=Mycobacterium sp. pV006 TaxID=3238983 RepID=UPI00351AD949